MLVGEVAAQLHAGPGRPGAVGPLVEGSCPRAPIPAIAVAVEVEPAAGAKEVLTVEGDAADCPGTF